MKRILILGAGFLQSFVIKRARELGHYVIALDKNPKSVGFKYANEYDILDIVDRNACFIYAHSKRVDGIMTAATDYGVLSAAYAANKLCLPSLEFDVAKITRDKFGVRRILHKFNVDDISQFYQVKSIDELSEIQELVQFPVIVKPSDGSGSKGISRADNVGELSVACSNALKYSHSHEILIEDYIEGKEYGIESFVYNGKTSIMGIMGKRMTKGPYYAELGHFFPCDLEVEAKVRRTVTNAITALGINFGAVNMDILVAADNRVYIIDVGARMGGNLIGSHIIPMATNTDYMGNIIRAAVGDPITHSNPTNMRSVATRLLALRPGRVSHLPNFDIISEKYDVDIISNLSEGDIIRQYRNNLDGCGYVLAAGDDLEDVEKRAEMAKTEIDFTIVRS